jgi:hemoglobin/transferrin/lactoferrin receptor protein
MGPCVTNGAQRKSRVENPRVDEDDAHSESSSRAHGRNVQERLRLNFGVFNLLDRKYWEWSDVRGRPANDPVIDRYSRPGIHARVSASYRF